MVSEDSGSPHELYDDMLLSHYQKDIKLEALTNLALRKGDPLPLLKLSSS